MSYLIDTLGAAHKRVFELVGELYSSVKGS